MDLLCDIDGALEVLVDEVDDGASLPISVVDKEASTDETSLED